MVIDDKIEIVMTLETLNIIKQITEKLVNRYLIIYFHYLNNISKHQTLIK